MSRAIGSVVGVRTLGVQFQVMQNGPTPNKNVTKKRPNRNKQVKVKVYYLDMILFTYEISHRQS